MIHIRKQQEEFYRIWFIVGWEFLRIYEDENLNVAINNAMVLEMREEEVIQSFKWTLADVLYSRYYWYTKFFVNYKKLYGKNGSMEQAQFKIIEEIDSSIGEVDAELLESIEKELGYED